MDAAGTADNLDHLTGALQYLGATAGLTATSISTFTSATTGNVTLQFTGSTADAGVTYTRYAPTYDMAQIPARPVWNYQPVYQAPPFINYYVPTYELMPFTYTGAGGTGYSDFSCLAPDAEEKAEKLLAEVLSSKQREEYAKEGHFYVRSKSGRLYQVTKGISKNVYLVSERGGERQRCFCIHPATNVPRADVMIAQKLLLETDEDSFLREAIEWPTAA